VTQTSENVTWLTQEAYDRLKAELDYLQGPFKVEIARKIEAARDENGGYHAAKEEQGKMHARALQLAQMLEKAQVGTPPTAAGTAGPGMIVKIAFDGDEDDTLEFLLGSREASATDLEVYSPQSPLGAAISGHKVGETASYELPNGKSISVKLLSAKPYAG
jgi:transcription elongation factor GreA